MKMLTYNCCCEKAPKLGVFVCPDCMVWCSIGNFFEREVMSKLFDVYRDGEFITRRESVNSTTPADAKREFIAHGFDTNIQVRPANLHNLEPSPSKNFDARGNRLKNWQKPRKPVTLTTGH